MGRTLRQTRRGSTARSKPASLWFLRMERTGHELIEAIFSLRDPVQVRLMYPVVQLEPRMMKSQELVRAALAIDWETLPSTPIEWHLIPCRSHRA